MANSRLFLGTSLLILALGGCGSDEAGSSSYLQAGGSGGAPTQTGGAAEPSSTGGESAGTGGEPSRSGGASPAAGGEPGLTGGSPSGGEIGGTGGQVDPTGGSATVGVPCGDGWGTDPIPGNVDLGLASNPEINGVDGGTADERAIFDQLNTERQAAGLAPLGWSDEVANVARSHAADLNQLDYFDHGSSTRPYRDDSGATIRDNWLPFPRLDFVYPGDFSRAGENIASTRDPVGQVIGMWMESDGHRAAILDEYGWTATHGGIGIDGRMVVFNPAQCNAD